MMYERLLHDGTEVLTMKRSCCCCTFSVSFSSKQVTHVPLRCELCHLVKKGQNKSPLIPTCLQYTLQKSDYDYISSHREMLNYIYIILFFSEIPININKKLLGLLENTGDFNWFRRILVKSRNKQANSDVI